MVHLSHYDISRRLFKECGKILFLRNEFFSFVPKKEKEKEKTNKQMVWKKKRVHGIFTHTIIANNLLLVANFLLVALINCKPPAFHVK
jgi:hypothetical protein